MIRFLDAAFDGRRSAVRLVRLPREDRKTIAESGWHRSPSAKFGLSFSRGHLEAESCSSEAPALRSCPYPLPLSYRRAAGLLCPKPVPGVQHVRRVRRRLGRDAYGSPCPKQQRTSKPLERLAPGASGGTESVQPLFKSYDNFRAKGRNLGWSEPCPREFRVSRRTLTRADSSKIR